MVRAVVFPVHLRSYITLGNAFHIFFYYKEAEEGESKRSDWQDERVARAENRRNDMKMRWTGGVGGEEGVYLRVSFIYCRAAVMSPVCDHSVFLIIKKTNMCQHISWTCVLSLGWMNYLYGDQDLLSNFRHCRRWGLSIKSDISALCYSVLSFITWTLSHTMKHC